MIASLDTSFFIGSWYRLYSPNVFPSLWPQLSDLANDGTAIASIEVKVELERKPDELLKWVTDRPNMLKDTDDATIERVKEILLDHPRLADPKSPENHADPFVIAVGDLHGGHVVCEEIKSGKKNKPKIPDVCKAIGIPYMSPLEFFEEAGISI